MEEREEGEISEGELSNISSEEEHLLRQRLQVLESYNHVLERKDRRRRSGASQGHKSYDFYRGLPPDLSEISGSDLENSIILNIQRKRDERKVCRKTKLLKSTKKRTQVRKALEKSKSHKNNDKLVRHQVISKKETAKHSNERSHKEKRKKPVVVKKVAESSDDTDYEYRNKRRKLQHSVKISGVKTDVSTLKMRLMNMFADKTNSLISLDVERGEDLVDANTGNSNEKVETQITQIDVSDLEQPLLEIKSSEVVVVESSDNDKQSDPKLNSDHTISDDDDLELLRQNALQTKLPKPPNIENELVNNLSDSEDSDELRLICLRSTLLKKAIAMKQKRKLRKRIATMSSKQLGEELSPIGDEVVRDNTDIESVDMEIGVSDGPDFTDDNVFKEDKISSELKQSHLEALQMPGDKELITDPNNKTNKLCEYYLPDQTKTELYLEKGEDIDEDEDLLRTKLLTSLSRKICKSDKRVAESTEVNSAVSKNIDSIKDNQQDAKKFIIHIGESDSGSDNEATKNLTKMHMKLSENVDFQQRLEVFLKTARKETENKLVPNAIEHSMPKQPGSPEKFVPKAVNHLPKSRQLEYRRLVKRMEELERLKQIRQATLNRCSNKTNEKSLKTKLMNETTFVEKPCSAEQSEGKPNIQPPTDLETQIALSRKRIAAESAKVLRLKEESTQLVQRHKTLAAELRNVRSAMFVNRREERNVQASLANMRHQHQLLLNRSKSKSANKAINNVVHGHSYKKTEAKAFGVIKKIKDIGNANLRVVKDGLVKSPNEKKNIPNKIVSHQLDLSQNKNAISLPKVSPVPKNSGLDVNVTTTVNVDGSSTVLSKIETSSKEDLTKSLQHMNPEHLNKKYLKDNTVTVTPELISKEVILNEPEPKPAINGIEKELDDYESPLAAMKFNLSLEGDPHGILCPFEVSGTCKDAGCKYLHPKVRL